MRQLKAKTKKLYLMLTLKIILILFPIGLINCCKTRTIAIKPIDNCALLVPSDLWFLEYPLLKKKPEKATKKELIKYILDFQKVALDNSTNTIKYIRISKKAIECYQQLLKVEAK